MRRNKVTPLCFRNRPALLFAALAAITGTCAGGSASVQQPTRRATSVVRTDVRTGRLIRTVVVPSKPIVARVVAPIPVTENTPEGIVPIPVSIDPGISQLVEQTASKYHVDPLLVHSVISVESNYNQYAMSNKGAQGLMQLIPSTARRFGVKNVFDPKENIEGGVRYLQYLSTLFPEDLRKTLAAYNAGEGAVVRYNNIPPYPETEQYVYKVGERYGKAVRAAKQKAAAAKPAVKTVAEERPNPVEQFVDAEGRLHLITRPAADNP